MRDGLVDDADQTITQLAEPERLTASYLTRLLQLANLAPEVIAAILDGRQPVELTASNLMADTRLPSTGRDSGRRLGSSSGLADGVATQSTCPIASCRRDIAANGSGGCVSQKRSRACRDPPQPWPVAHATAMPLVAIRNQQSSEAPDWHDVVSSYRYQTDSQARRLRTPGPVRR